jgi:hypothetical protein
LSVQSSLLGRPTFMSLPAAHAGGAIASTVCIGNRVYTDLGDDELYVVVAGRDVERVAASLAAIIAANESLGTYHRDRRRALATE